MLASIIKAIVLIIEEILLFRKKHRELEISQEKLAEMFEEAAKKMRSELQADNKPSKDLQDQMDREKF